MQSLSKYQWVLLRTRTNNPKNYVELQNTLSSHSNHEKKNKTECNMLPDFKLYYSAMIKALRTVLARRPGTYISGTTREPRSKFSLVWSINL